MLFIVGDNCVSISVCHAELVSASIFLSLASESRKKIKSSEYRIFGLNKKRKYGTLQA